MIKKIVSKQVYKYFFYSSMSRWVMLQPWTSKKGKICKGYPGKD
jgi:hypothetical protein